MNKETRSIIRNLQNTLSGEPWFGRAVYPILEEAESNDWREIDPNNHTWKNGMGEFRKIQEQIVSILETKEDSFLKEIVPGREFNFRFMLNGLIRHNIYHAGQVAYLNKMLC